MQVGGSLSEVKECVRREGIGALWKGNKGGVLWGYAVPGVAVLVKVLASRA